MLAVQITSPYGEWALREILKIVSNYFDNPTDFDKSSNRDANFMGSNLSDPENSDLFADEMSDVAYIPAEPPDDDEPLLAHITD